MLLGYRVTLERIYIASPETAAPETDTEELPLEMLRRVDKVWMRVEKALWDALRPFAEARDAVAQALEAMEPVNSS